MTRGRRIEAIVAASLILIGAVILAYQFQFNQRLIYARAHAYALAGEYGKAMRWHARMLRWRSGGKPVDEARRESAICRISKREREEVLEKLRAPCGLERHWAASLDDYIKAISSRSKVGVLFYDYYDATPPNRAIQLDIKPDMTFGEILGELTTPLGLTSVVRNQTVFITTNKTANAFRCRLPHKSPPAEEDDLVIWKRLQEKSGLTFPGGQTTPGDISALFKQVAEISIRIVDDHSCCRQGIPLADSPFYLPMISPDVTFANILSLMALALSHEPYVYDWTISRQTVFFGLEEEVAARERVTSSVGAQL